MTADRETPSAGLPNVPAEHTPTWKAQHAWSEVDRTAPPKRTAVERVADFLEIYQPYDEATAMEQASRCVMCPTPLCTLGCPLGNRIPEWMTLTAEGQFLEAAELSQSTSNMPEICSRVCPQERLCEGMCVLNAKAEPVSIGAVEKFINEYAFRHGAVEVAVAPPNGMRVAVAGSGPGGLACADELAKKGCEVVVFESQLVPGGLLVNGLPAFKIEKSVVERRINLLKAKGIAFRLGVEVGRDVTLGELSRDYDAVYLGFGAQQAKPIDVPGAQLKGVVQALPFLIQKNTDYPLNLPPIPVEGRRVAVLGGGDTAMDCLRTALRGGATEAVCLYRRDFENMPGSRREYDNAVEEGARFCFLTNPLALVGNATGNVTHVRCIQMQLTGYDSSGRRRPVPVPGSEFEVPVDLLVVAYGFDPVPFPKDSDLNLLKLTEWGTVVTDDDQMTSVPGVFAGGDLVRGASLVVHAVRDARRAAEAIDRYLLEKYPTQQFARDWTSHVVA